MIDRFQRISAIYAFMDKGHEKVWAHEYLGPGHPPVTIDIWRGRLIDIAQALELSIGTVHAEIGHLITMDCLTLLMRGSRHNHSVYLLSGAPDEELWQQQHERNFITGRMVPITKAQRENDRINRLVREVEKLKHRVEMLERGQSNSTRRD
jgi:hypothetical protein